jgi:hypothetical protein
MKIRTAVLSVMLIIFCRYIKLMSGPAYPAGAGKDKTPAFLDYTLPTAHR